MKKVGQLHFDMKRMKEIDLRTKVFQLNTQEITLGTNNKNNFN